MEELNKMEETQKEEKQETRKKKPTPPEPVGGAIISASTPSELYIPENLFEKALENPEILTKVMDVRREIRDEIARKKFYEDLAKAQSEIGPIEKNMKVLNKDGSIRYRYASLDKVLNAIKPIYKYGFSIRHESELKDGNTYIITTWLVHSGGWSEKSVFVSKIGQFDQSRMTPIQEIGAIESYGRRYNILKLLNLAGDEDIDAGTNTVIEKENTLRVVDKVKTESDPEPQPQPQPQRSVNGSRLNYNEMLRTCFSIISKEFPGTTKDQHIEIWHKFLNETFGIQSSKQLPQDVGYSDVIKFLNNWIATQKQTEQTDNPKTENSEDELPF